MKLNKVAVISPHRRYFKEWVDKNKKEGEKYYCISQSVDTCGLHFQRIESVPECLNMPFFRELYTRCTYLIRN